MTGTLPVAAIFRHNRRLFPQPHIPKSAPSDIDRQNGLPGRYRRAFVRFVRYSDGINRAMFNLAMNITENYSESRTNGMVK